MGNELPGRLASGDYNSKSGTRQLRLPERDPESVDVSNDELTHAQEDITRGVRVPSHPRQREGELAHDGLANERKEQVGPHFTIP